MSGFAVEILRDDGRVFRRVDGLTSNDMYDFHAAIMRHRAGPRLRPLIGAFGAAAFESDHGAPVVRDPTPSEWDIPWPDVVAGTI